jgi:acyl-lipid omega-6 desaturase (Delta-12 desaturase)
MQPAYASGWQRIARSYERPDTIRSTIQLVTTVMLIGASCWLMWRAMTVSYLLTLALALPTACFIVRAFVIMHDCAHGSFYHNRVANEIVGWITGVFIFTPFTRWRKEHALHHASVGDLDERGDGDTWTLTVREYEAKPRRVQLGYRLYRSPFLFPILGPFKYAFAQRFAPSGHVDGPRERASVRETNLALLALFIGFSALIGPVNVLLVYWPAYQLALGIGAWIIWVQHQFEDTYWANHPEWDHATAALEGSSYFALPGLLNWLTCDIGLHHIHHLCPKIPNYRLRAAFEDNAMFQRAHRITLRESWSAVQLALWDEDARRLIGFHELADRRHRITNAVCEAVS